MTEQEIIDYLKNNKKEGRILAFMPEEVKEWCEKHREELFVWRSHRWSVFEDAVNICTSDAVTLPDDYKVKEEPEGGEWVEFDIDKNGDFDVCGIANDKNSTITYNWTQWNKPIRDNASKNFINGCCAFGGWQYAKSNTWFMTPRLKFIIANSISYKDNDALADCCTTPSACKCEPAIPVKIRFWRKQ